MRLGHAPSYREEVAQATTDIVLRYAKPKGLNAIQYQGFEIVTLILGQV